MKRFFLLTFAFCLGVAAALGQGFPLVPPSGGGGSGDALVANPLSQFAATTSAQLAGVVSDENGSGKSIFAAGTLAITTGKTFTVGNTITLAGTDAQTYTFPTTSATIARTDAANTFTGTQTFGAVVGTSWNGNTWATGTGTLAIAAGKTLTASNTITLAGTDAQTYTFPTTSATIARTDAANTFAGNNIFSGTDNQFVHLKGTATPSAVCGTGAGATPPTPTVTGNDSGMRVVFTAAASPATTATVFTVTFATPYTTTPVVVGPIVCNAGANNAQTSTKACFLGTVSTTGFTLVSNAVALTSATYDYGFNVYTNP